VFNAITNLIMGEQVYCKKNLLHFFFVLRTLFKMVLRSNEHKMSFEIGESKSSFQFLKYWYYETFFYGKLLIVMMSRVALGTL